MEKTEVASLKRKFLKGIGGQPALALLEFLPETQFWMKDREGRFMAANSVFLKACGAVTETALLGLTDLDIWPRHLAAGYREDDRRVMRSGKPVMNKLELSRNAKGGSDWFCTTKIPLFGPSGAVWGTAGFARDLKKTLSTVMPYMEMSGVIAHILVHFAENLSLASLASMASMSASQFERRFKKGFGATPTEYIRSVRIQAACQYLAESELSISQIAFKTGHYDHSHFNRCFRAVTGQSATSYRNGLKNPGDSRSS